MNVVPYADGREHLQDELRLIDQLIRLHLLRKRRHFSSGRLDQFTGLVVSDEEVERMLVPPEPLLEEEKGQYNDTGDERELRNVIESLTDNIVSRRHAAEQVGIVLPLPHLSRLFQLTKFEEQCLVMCLGPEIDRKYENIYAYLNNDITRKNPSICMAINVLCAGPEEMTSARMLFDKQSPLLKYRLLHIDDWLQEKQLALTRRGLLLDSRMVNFLAGLQHVDERIQDSANVVFSGELTKQPPTGVDIRKQIGMFLQAYLKQKHAESGGKNVLVYLHGPYGSGKRSLAAAVAHDLGVPALMCDLSKIVQPAASPGPDLGLVVREAVLHQAMLCFENSDSLFTGDEPHMQWISNVVDAVKTASPVTVMLGCRPWPFLEYIKDFVFAQFELTIPDEATRKLIWDTTIKERFFDSSMFDTGALASKFRFTSGQIEDSIDTARNAARWRTANESAMTMDDLHRACRTGSNQKLSALARKIDPCYTWDHLVLPQDQKRQLREICNRISYRHVVYGKWGFGRNASLGKGLNALFSGPSGTGKTMAAEVLAHELGLDLYKIDLSQVVSKYIGETEKNLGRIFTEAETSNAILFFDEADALFGRRSEVKDAHDRYANIEVGYLLQKMEEYDGIAVLATNLRQNIDDAFLRRMQFAVEFPFPDERHRELIWKGIFPAEAEVSPAIDYAFLANRLRISGGLIKNISLAAAFFAATENVKISMNHIMRAAKREYAKIGSPFLKSDLDPYYSLAEEP